MLVSSSSIFRRSRSITFVHQSTTRCRDLVTNTLTNLRRRRKCLIHSFTRLPRASHISSNRQPSTSPPSLPRASGFHCCDTLTNIRHRSNEADIRHQQASANDIGLGRPSSEIRRSNSFVIKDNILPYQQLLQNDQSQRHQIFILEKRLPDF